MDIQTQIEQKLTDSFEPVHLQVIDESYKHQAPKEAKTHFRLIIASSKFIDTARLERHRQVYRVLHLELAGSIKALSVSAFDPEEWHESNGVAPSSPPCLGGSGQEKALAH